MYRKPETKAQARILKSAFEEHGVDLAHRQVLDIIAHMNGHANWHVMREHEKTSPTPAVTAKPPASHSVPVERDRVYVFEAMGFVENRSTLDSLDSYSDALDDALQARLENLGFYSFCRVDVSSDDDQSNFDIKVFITVRVTGPGNHARIQQMQNDLESVPALKNFLDDVAFLICENDASADKLSVEWWELVQTTNI